MRQNTREHTGHGIDGIEIDVLVGFEKSRVNSTVYDSARYKCTALLGMEKAKSEIKEKVMELLSNGDDNVRVCL